MKRTAYLINTARGELIDETALARALREGWIGGAALDTFSGEPLPRNHPFFSVPNILLSPHRASRDRGTRGTGKFSDDQEHYRLHAERSPSLLSMNRFIHLQRLRTSYCNEVYITSDKSMKKK